MKMVFEIFEKIGVADAEDTQILEAIEEYLEKHPGKLLFRGSSKKAISTEEALERIKKDKRFREELISLVKERAIAELRRDGISFQNQNGGGQYG